MGLFHFRSGCFVLSSAALLTLSGCSTAQFGVTVPIGSHTGIGISVGADGRIGVGVGVSSGGGTVSVGTSGQLPVKKDGETDTPQQ